MPRRMVQCTNAPCVARIEVRYPKGADVEPYRCGLSSCPVTPKLERTFVQPKAKSSGKSGGRK